MSKFSEFRAGEYLKVGDLGGREVTVQIESISVEQVGSEAQKRDKLVARFEGKSKGLVLNDTNLEALELAFGADTDLAIGGQVILYVDPNVRFGGQRVGGIRIKMPARKTATPEKSVAAELDDQIPF